MTILRAVPLILFALLLGLFGFTLIKGKPMEASPLQSQPLPDFVFEDVIHAGQGFSAGTMKKPALLVFWASWCGICKIDLPVTGRFARAHEIPLYGIAYHDQLQPLRNAVAGLSHDVTFTGLGLDATGTVSSQFGLVGVPTTFVIGRDGKVQKVYAGQVSQKVLENDVLPLLR